MRSLIPCALVAVWAAEASGLSHNHRHIHAKRDIAAQLEKVAPDGLVNLTGPGMGENGVLWTKTDVLRKCSEAGNHCEKIYSSSSLEDFQKTQAQSNTGSGTKLASPSPFGSRPVSQAKFFESFPHTSGGDEQPTTQAATSATMTEAATTEALTTEKVPGASGPGQCPGVDCVFRNKELPCSEFPQDYGLVPITWQNFRGWTGIQEVPKSRANIRTIVDGKAPVSRPEDETEVYYSYACPNGYEKTQWPQEQGANGESIGGLLCNTNGMLELTRPEFKILCARCAGDVFVKNTLPDQNVAICRTDYPGTEAMIIPTDVPPNTEVELCNPFQDTFLKDGQKTTAHYYTNLPGVKKEDACVWNSPGELLKMAGDKSPIILGTGLDRDFVVGEGKKGGTFTSAKRNPLTSQGTIDFKIDVVVDESAEPKYTYNSAEHVRLQPGASDYAPPSPFAPVGSKVTFVFGKGK